MRGVKELFAGRPIPRCSGILARASRFHETPDGEIACGSVRDLDRLPYPEFGDYFQRLGHSPLSNQIDPLLLFESARGCWWGAKTQCTFCGLNGGSIGFRSKSALRVIDELRYLRRTHGVRRACATDNDSVDEPEILRKLNEWMYANVMVCIDGACPSLALVLDRSCRICHASR